MAFRPRSYEEALEYINRRKDKQSNRRVISRRQEKVHVGSMGGGAIYSTAGQPVQIRDQLLAHTNDPLSTYGDNPPPLSFRQWNTDIATFYPNGNVLVVPYDSPSTRERMSSMGLPETVSLWSAGLTKNQQAVVEQAPRLMLKGFPYGVPGSKEVMLRPDGTPHECEVLKEYVMVEAKPGLHAAYQLGRKRVLRVLKQYSDMVEATTGECSLFMAPPKALNHLAEVSIDCHEPKWLREEWLPSLLESYEPDTIQGIYEDFLRLRALYNTTGLSRLWTQAKVPSQELHLWLK